MVRIRYEIDTGRVNLITTSEREIPVDGHAYITVAELPRFKDDGSETLYVENGQLVVRQSEPPPPIIVAVNEISNRQFYQALAMKGEITQNEALAAVIGKIPGRFEAVIEHLPADHQFPARMLLTGASTFERSHPLVDNLSAALGWSTEEVDALWRLAGNL